MEEFELDEGEVILRDVRQHVFMLALRLLPYALLAIAPLLLLPFIDLVLSLARSEGSTLAFDPLSSGFRFFLGLWWLFVWMGVFNLLTRYYLTVWVLTSHRIVYIQQTAFFRRSVSSFLLARVQDVTTDVHGIFATIIGYGDIHVQTAGDERSFRMPGMPRPEEIRDLIMQEVTVIHREDPTLASQGL